MSWLSNVVAVRGRSRAAVLYRLQVLASAAKVVMLKFIKHEKLLLQHHPELNEKWVQDRIAEDPSILGIGDVVLKDKERIQPRAGRLDLLLQDPESLRRYEVEIQLGKTDEAHIIRTIEYWDIERKRYPPDIRRTVDLPADADKC